MTTIRKRKVLREWRAQDSVMESVYSKRYDSLSEDSKSQVNQIVDDLSDATKKFIDCKYIHEDDVDDQNSITRLNQSLNEMLRSIMGAYEAFAELHLITKPNEVE